MRTTVVAGIVHHENSALPPLHALGIQMGDQLQQEVSEGEAVGVPTVHSVHQLPGTGDGSYDVHSINPSGSGDLVLHVAGDPTPHTVVCELDD